jgi:hypothetical protein
VTYEDVVALGLALPGVEESTSYGTPALKLKGKLLARLKEDGVTLVLIPGFEERDRLMRSRPRVFFITEHYRNYPAVLVRLPLVRPAQLRELLELGYRRVAPRSLLAALDAAARQRHRRTR